MTNLPQTVQIKLNAFGPKMQAWLKRQSEGGLDRLESKLFIVIGPVALAYLCSSIAGGLIAQSFVSGIVSNRARMNVRADDSMKPAFERPVMANVRDLQKIIKERNLFNSEGKFPEEKSGGEGGGSLARFDINAPCVPTALPIELMGTIYLGDPAKSLATVREKNYEEADIYRVGDAIYGNDQALVAAVERQKLVINNNGTKECIDLDKSKENVAGDGFPAYGGGDFGSSGPVVGGGSEINLDAGFVESELGPGFGKVVDSARLVPNTIDGGINGFKIFSIKGGTLFARIGLQNGDVITQVNDTSMKNPEAGFSLYSAFQDDKEVRIQLLRGGSTPQNITVRIK